MSQTTLEPVAVISIRQGPALRPLLQQAAFWAMIAFIVAVALVLGLRLREYAWYQTEPIRYVLDINNAFRQGSASLVDIGFIDRYDERTSRPEALRSNGLDLDYAPGRLAVATLWARWVRQQVEWPKPGRGVNPWTLEFYEHARQLQEDDPQPGESWQYRLCKPLLMLNTALEILSSIAMFLLVRRYTSGQAPNSRPRRGIILGLIASLFLWFNPALIWNAHCWPQWDSWVLPFFLWAVLLASLDWWFCAGALIATGAMFKGQILFGAPLLLLWPLFQGRLPAVARWLVGLATATAAITAVWLVRTPGVTLPGNRFVPGNVNQTAIHWVAYLVVIFCAMVAVCGQPRTPMRRVWIGVAIAAGIGCLIGMFTGHILAIIGFLVAGWVIDNRLSAWTWARGLPLGWLAVAILIYPIFVLAPVQRSIPAAAPAGHTAAPLPEKLPDAALPESVGLVFFAVGVLGILFSIFPPRRVLPFAAAGWVSVSLLLCMRYFDTSRGWFDLGFGYGTYHFEDMSRGEPNNLPELMKLRWQWDDLLEPAIMLPKGAFSDSIADVLQNIDPGLKHKRLRQPDGSVGLPLKYLLVSVWLISVILCSIAAAMHDRNRSPRFLLAICTPWIMFFAVMVQMHQRYLLWGASLSAAAAILSPAFAALHIFLSLVAASQEAHSMLGDDQRYWGNQLYQFLQNWHPGITWAVLLCAGIFLYSTLKPSRKSST